jgi:diguanylate cyclase (GGDEF)-like protein
MEAPRRGLGEIARRPWYQLEDRHTGVLAGRLAALAVVAAGVLLVPQATLPVDTATALAACAAAAVAHALLWLAPRRWPRRLRLAVDLGLVVDAAWATALAHAAGGPYSPLAALFLVTALWAALGYSARTGLKAAVLASLGFLALVWYADGGRLWSAASLGRLALFWGILAAAVASAAAGERELRIRAERLEVLHRAARDLLAAEGADAMVEAAGDAGRRLLADWRVSVRLGPAPDGVRLLRLAGEGVVVVPVTAGGRALGAIECRRPLVAGRARHRVRLREISALETLAAGLGSALWRAELTERIARQSLTDGLTGLGNRRAFDEQLARRLAEARRSGAPLALCLLDVDRFKSYNDTFGHRAGDEALAAVAAAVAAACRASDVPARYGGEELAVLLPGTVLADAVEVAERIRAAVAATPTRHRPVTVSIGVAATDGGHSAEVLVEAADRALYEAKEGGRDRVVAGRADAEGAPRAGA